jgi:peptide deformylase
MSVCPVLPWPHPLLAQPSGKVEKFDAHIEQICRDLYDTAQAAEAPMMSAVQIGARAQIVYISKQICGQPLMLINPVVESKSVITQHHKEACASTPGVIIDMQRAASIVVSAKNKRGDEFTVRADGLFAQALQHELNHLEGKTIIDCAKRAKRWFYKERMAKYGGAKGHVLDYRELRLDA